MTSNITKLWLRLPPQGRKALAEGQLEIVEVLDKMPRGTLDEGVRRFNYWITSNIKLLDAIEKLYPRANDNTDN